MAITLALFHTSGKHRSRRHLLSSVVQNVGRVLCILFTITPSIPLGPGHFLSCRWLIVSSTSWYLKFGTAWEAGSSVPDTYSLMFLCCAPSCAMGSSGKNLWMWAFAVSFADFETDPCGRVSEVGTGCLAKPAFHIL